MQVGPKLCIVEIVAFKWTEPFNHFLISLFLCCLKSQLLLLDLIISEPINEASMKVSLRLMTTCCSQCVSKTKPGPRFTITVSSLVSPPVFSFALDPSGSVGSGQPQVNAIRTNSALIGGTGPFSPSLFLCLCLIDTLVMVQTWSLPSEKPVQSFKIAL